MKHMAGKENMPTFRTAIGGYNKEDINNYIREINADFLTATREFEDRINSLEKAVRERDDNLSELKKEIDLLSADKKAAEEADALVTALRERCETMAEEVAKLKEDKLASDLREEASARRIEELQGIIDELRQQEEDGELSHKAEMYDKMSGQLGRVMLDARENAGEIVAQAQKNAAAVRAEAETALSEAEGEAERIIKGAESERACTEDKLRRLKVEFGRSAAEIAENIGEEYCTLIRDMCEKLQGLSDDVRDETQKFMGKLESECNSKLDEIVKKTEIGVCNEKHHEAGSDVMNEAADTRKKSREYDSKNGNSGNTFGEAAGTYKKNSGTETEKKDVFSALDRFFTCGDRVEIDYGAAD